MPALVEANQSLLTKIFKIKQVVGWQHGEGYFCKDSKDDNQYTFKDFAENGEYSKNQFHLRIVQIFITF
jgi:hypothetical protein